MSDNSWVTLATNDSYSLGALVLAHSLRRVGTIHKLTVMVTPGVTPAMRHLLSAAFHTIEEVNILDSKDAKNLALLTRPELGITFTKLHCWRLTQFAKCVFLDADVLVLQNCDELFGREELSAAPDVGWPDCFNSGVFVYRPSVETYDKIVNFALTQGSFDGGDQGLLNQFFSDWATKDISRHLPFIYNMCSSATYSYLPAFKQFGKDVKIVHFIGVSKPWLQYLDSETRQVRPSPGSEHLQELLQLWWNIFCQDIHSGLSSDMVLRSSQVSQPESSPMSHIVREIFYNLDSHFPHSDSHTLSTAYEHNPSDGYWDPWESYREPDVVISITHRVSGLDSNNSNSFNKNVGENHNQYSQQHNHSEHRQEQQHSYNQGIHMTSHDQHRPYGSGEHHLHHREHHSPNQEYHFHHQEHHPHHQEHHHHQQPQWEHHDQPQQEHHQPQQEHHQPQQEHHHHHQPQQEHHHHHQSQQEHHHHQPQHEHHHHQPQHEHHHHQPQHEHHHHQPQHEHHYQQPQHEHHHQPQQEIHHHQEHNNHHHHQEHNNHHHHQEHQRHHQEYPQNHVSQKHTFHQHHEHHSHHPSHYDPQHNHPAEHEGCSTHYSQEHGHGEPQIPLDKVSESTSLNQALHTYEEHECDPSSLSHNTSASDSDLLSGSANKGATTEFTNKDAGLAGAFSKLTLGAPRSAEQIALEEHLRKQAWEHGSIDYLGRDSFDNIWRKICETLAEDPQAEPSPEQSKPSDEISSGPLDHTVAQEAPPASDTQLSTVSSLSEPPISASVLEDLSSTGSSTSANLSTKPYPVTESTEPPEVSSAHSTLPESALLLSDPTIPAPEVETEPTATQLVETVVALPSAHAAPVITSSTEVDTDSLTTLTPATAVSRIDIQLTPQSEALSPEPDFIVAPVCVHVVPQVDNTTAAELEAAEVFEDTTSVVAEAVVSEEASTASQTTLTVDAPHPQPAEVDLAVSVVASPASQPTGVATAGSEIQAPLSQPAEVTSAVSVAEVPISQPVDVVPPQPQPVPEVSAGLPVQPAEPAVAAAKEQSDIMSECHFSYESVESVDSDHLSEPQPSGPIHPVPKQLPDSSAANVASSPKDQSDKPLAADVLKTPLTPGTEPVVTAAFSMTVVLPPATQDKFLSDVAAGATSKEIEVVPSPDSAAPQGVVVTKPTPPAIPADATVPSQSPQPDSGAPQGVVVTEPTPPAAPADATVPSQTPQPDSTALQGVVVTEQTPPATPADATVPSLSPQPDSVAPQGVVVTEPTPPATPADATVPSQSPQLTADALTVVPDIPATPPVGPTTPDTPESTLPVTADPPGAAEAVVSDAPDTSRAQQTQSRQSPDPKAPIPPKRRHKQPQSSEQPSGGKSTKGAKPQRGKK